MGFQAAQRTECKPAKVFLQLPNVMSTQPHVVNEISRTLKVAQMYVVEFLAKLLLRLQNLQPEGLELRDQRLDFKLEIPAHKEE